MVLIAVNSKPAVTAVFFLSFFLSFQFRQIEGKRETTRNGNLISALHINNTVCYIYYGISDQNSYFVFLYVISFLNLTASLVCHAIELLFCF
jgi:hypothetical protein